MAVPYDTVAPLLTGHLGLDPAAVSPGASLASMRLDSIALIELSIVIEERFGIVLDESAADPHMTLAEFCAGLESAGAL